MDDHKTGQVPVFLQSVKSTPDGLHQYLAGKPPGNMGHRELSYKGKALVINGLLTSNLWYNVMSLLVPSWAIA